MKKQLYLFVVLFFPLFIQAQNVGIGTITPTEKLEIKNPLRSTLKMSSNSTSDTTELQLSNKTVNGFGTFYTDFSIKSVREEGLFFSSSSDFGPNNATNSLVILPNGNVGTGIAVPTAKLHVNGGVKVQGLNLFELGAGVAGKEMNAGKIGYNAFGTNALTFVGAGTNATNRAVYFFAEGGTTFSGPALITGNTNIGGQLQLNGNSGAAGQVLSSNGAGDPSWTNAAYGNNTRFAVKFSGVAGISGTTVIGPTYYNTNTADIVISSSGITFNRSGLYHFDLGVFARIDFTSAISGSPLYGAWLFFGLPNSLELIDDKIMTPSTSAASNTTFFGHEKVSAEVYISAPATISVYQTFSTLGLGGGATTHSFNGFVTCHLINQ
ncbi:hypothetical protein [Ferruginibacter sp.]